jgi:Ca2+-binding EF-hand superfamily protein
MSSFTTTDNTTTSSSSTGGGNQRAYNHQECAVCYDLLTCKPVSNIVDDEDVKVCYHSFHSACLATLTVLHCPICAKEFHHTVPAPSVILDSVAWFKHMDVNDDGNLTYEELLEGLKGQLDVEWSQVEMDLDSFFHRWDTDRDGVISFEEFNDQQNGVVAYLLHNHPKNPRPEPPNLLTTGYDEWFNYWDENNSNSLDRSEVLRALIKTFKIYHIERSAIATILDSLWPIFDTDGNGVIERGEFIEGGLGETIAAQILQETGELHLFNGELVNEYEGFDGEEEKDEIINEVPLEV